MKTSINFPPNYEQVLAAFPAIKNYGVIFTYGDTIYNPKRVAITPDLFAHEEVHQKQQGDKPELWWDNYIKYPPFRLAQELEAYSMQYKFAKENYSRSARRKLLRFIVTALSGPIYGNLISSQEAEKLITAI